MTLRRTREWLRSYAWVGLLQLVVAAGRIWLKAASMRGTEALQRTRPALEDEDQSIGFAGAGRMPHRTRSAR